jgi:hypothetical protein
MKIRHFIGAALAAPEVKSSAHRAHGVLARRECELTHET